MKKILFLGILLCGLMISSTTLATSVRGFVTYYNDSSNKIIIETSRGFTCGEVYGYAGLLDKGDVVVGELESYGFQEIYDVRHDNSIRIYIDEYWLDSEQALEWLGR